MLLCAEPTASFPAKIGAKSGMLTIRIYNSRDQQTPPEAVSLLVNGCAAHNWRQVLTFGIWLTFGDARCSSHIDRSFYRKKKTFVEGSCKDESEASTCSPGGIRSNRY